MQCLSIAFMKKTNNMNEVERYYIPPKIIPTANVNYKCTVIDVALNKLYTLYTSHSYFNKIDFCALLC